MCVTTSLLILPTASLFIAVSSSLTVHRFDSGCLKDLNPFFIPVCYLFLFSTCLFSVFFFLPCITWLSTSDAKAFYWETLAFHYMGASLKFHFVSVLIITLLGILIPFSNSYLWLVNYIEPIRKLFVWETVSHNACVLWLSDRKEMLHKPRKKCSALH